MYTRITKAGGHQYLQLVESYRNESGRPRVRVIASLGRLDKIQKTKKIDTLINGLARAAGRAQTDDGDIVYELATEHGSLFALDGLWRDLGLDKSLRCALRSGRRKFDAEELIRVMVFNRLCDPRSKSGILRWLRKVSMPGVSAKKVTHQRLLRAMDALEKDAERAEKELAASFRPLLDEELTIAFYDLTTVRIHGEKNFEGDIRAYGKSKDTGGVARQFTLGLVQTADGLPLLHRVHPGAVAETKTLQSIVSEVLERFPVKRLVLVADRGLLSYDNIGELEKLSGKDGRKLEFILAVPARRYARLAEAFREIDEGKIGKVAKNGERIAELEFAGHRLVVANDPTRAKERTEKREKRLGEFQRMAREMAARLDATAAGEKIYGPRLTEQEARDRLADAVSGAKFKKFMQTRCAGGRFCWTIDEAAVEKAELFDGKLAVVTNVEDLAPAEVIARYKELADIERGFRVLKSEIEIAPVFHWLPERIRAHALICFLALVLHRVMRMRLKAAGVTASPETVLETLAEIQRHRIFIDKRKHEGNTAQTPVQEHFFDALKVSKPA